MHVLSQFIDDIGNISPKDGKTLETANETVILRSINDWGSIMLINPSSRAKQGDRF